jgi:hypothetical protein
MHIRANTIIYVEKLGSGIFFFDTIVALPKGLVLITPSSSLHVQKITTQPYP